MTTRLIVLAIAVACALAWSLPAYSIATVDFEVGRTRNGEAIGDLIPGLRFTTTTGGDVLFGYIGDGEPYNYLWKSDNGKQDPQWSFWMSGDCAAYVMGVNDAAVINFVGDTADFFSVGYSSGQSYYLKVEAYDSLGRLMGPAVTGLPNSQEEHGGPGGIAYLNLDYDGMSSVRLYGSPPCGGFWIIDNLSYLPTHEIPEPSSLAFLASALVPIALRRRRG